MKKIYIYIYLIKNIILKKFRFNRIYISRKRPRRVPSKKALPLKIVIKTAQSSAEVMAVF